MTGHLHFYRQLSSTTGAAKNPSDAKPQPKLRRCSSVNDSFSLEVAAELHCDKEKPSMVFNRSHIMSDPDSGTEDLDEQTVNIQMAQLNSELPGKFSEICTSTRSEMGSDDEAFSEIGSCVDSVHDDEQHECTEEARQNIMKDLELATKIPHAEKKDFCANTCVAFHGEFARLISVPLSLHSPGLRYHLIPEEAFPFTLLYGQFGETIFPQAKLDNAKAQFKCPNVHCQHAWTSMRARICFKISLPVHSLIAMKIFTQACQRCNAASEPLWYIDEVCRVMKNLQIFIYDFLGIVDPSIIAEQKQQEIWQSNGRSRHSSRHDPTQRPGKMNAFHNSRYCEACQLGFCFA